MENKKIIDMIICILGIVGFLLIIIGSIYSFYYFIAGLIILIVSDFFMMYDLLKYKRNNNKID